MWGIYISITICYIYNMITISKASENIVRSSDFAIQGMQNRLLNLTAYAKLIRKSVSSQAKKHVEISSIVVALSRLQPKIEKEEKLLPKIVIDRISVKPHLVETVFTKNTHTLKSLQRLYKSSDIFKKYLTVTHGLHEISITTVEENYKNILECFKPHKPTTLVRHLASISLEVHPKYTYAKNTFYSLLKTLAPHKINVIELLTTATEISFLVEEKDWQNTFNIFNELFKIEDQDYLK